MQFQAEVAQHMKLPSCKICQHSLSFQMDGSYQWVLFFQTGQKKSFQIYLNMDFTTCTWIFSTYKFKEHTRKMKNLLKLLYLWNPALLSYLFSHSHREKIRQDTNSVSKSSSDLAFLKWFQGFFLQATDT